MQPEDYPEYCNVTPMTPAPHPVDKIMDLMLKNLFEGKETRTSLYNESVYAEVQAARKRLKVVFDTSPTSAEMVLEERIKELKKIEDLIFKSLKFNDFGITIINSIFSNRIAELRQRGRERER